MFARLIFIFVLIAPGFGCRKQSTSAESSESAAPIKATDEVQPGPALGELTQAVRKYAAEQQRVPKSLEEVIAAGYLNAVPSAPAGKKFAIDKNLQVYLSK